MERSSPRDCVRRGVLATIGLVAAMTLACDRNIEPYQPGEEPREPDLARIFPGPPGGAGAVAQQEESGQMARGAVPPSRAAGSGAAGGEPPSAAASSSAPIRGEIDLASELVSARPGGGVLFVIARPQGATAGPPLAVLRIPSPEFPLAFSIGPENVMIPSMQFAGPISLSARLDADGNAMTRGPGDISSPIEEQLAPGAVGVRLILSEKS